VADPICWSWKLTINGEYDSLDSIACDTVLVEAIAVVSPHAIVAGTAEHVVIFQGESKVADLVVVDRALSIAL
jgi:hypothetical protein